VLDIPLANIERWLKQDHSALIGSKNGADSLLQPNIVRREWKNCSRFCAIEASLNLSGTGK
jgi:hypothetical protein